MSIKSVTQNNPKDKETTITVTCPDAIVKYNSHMGGVDRNDQLRGYYNIQIKSRKYYKYLFYAAMDVAITNSFIMSKFFPNLKKKHLKDVRIELAKQLIGNYNTKKRKGRQSQFQPVAGFSSMHFPTKAQERMLLMPTEWKTS